MHRLQLDLPDELWAILGDGDRPLEQAILEMVVLELYRRRIISSGRAAELLEMDQFAFIRHASSLGIPYFDLTREELEDDVRVAEALWSDA
jgi:predicted HTH domain antitoxin